MSKVKVLVVPSDRSGVGKFRSVDPHIFLQNQYPEEFHVDIVYEPPYEDINFWTQYQIVAFHRSIGQDFDKANRLIQFFDNSLFKMVKDFTPARGNTWTEFKHRWRGQRNW